MTLRQWNNWPAQLATLLTGLLLAVYTYGLVAGTPYVGFKWDPRSGAVLAVFSAGDLNVGDHLIQIGATTWEQYRADQRRPLLDTTQAGQTIDLIVERANERQAIMWTIPGFNTPEFRGRLTNQWFLAWIFWLMGGLTFLLVRPCDNRWRLLLAFNYLIAIDLLGTALSYSHIYESAIIVRMSNWLLAPVSWHLHWIFPQPLRRLPGWLWAGAYVLAGGLAALEWWQQLPPSLYLMGLLAALLGVLVPQTMRLLQRNQPPAARLLWVGAIAAVAPSIVLGTVTLVAPPGFDGFSFFGVMLGWAALPLLYFYAAYRRQLAGQELRANRAISLYLFVSVLVVACAILIPAVAAAAPTLTTDPWVNVIAAVVISLATLLGFAPFQHFVERNLLGIPAPLTRRLPGGFTRLAPSPNLPTLIHNLRDDFLPRLLVRESALLRLDEAGQLHCLYAQQAPHLPEAADLTPLLAEAERYRLPAEVTGQPQPFAWVRVCLPLRLPGQLIGVWLLGRRDPDDLYGQLDIHELRAIADQIAVSLAHLLQTERLRQLYQSNIDRDERERTRLALELHDEILNELALLAPGRATAAPDPATQAVYDRVIERIRQMISGLRPAMLTYGLHSALEQLADDLADRAGNELEVHVALDGDERYPEHVEQHLFRIVQQASENAVRHAAARNLRLQAIFQKDLVELRVDDDGCGLPPEALGELNALIEQRHFGLAGMHERAALIGAQLWLQSGPGHGTSIRITWRPTSPNGQPPGR